MKPAKKKSTRTTKTKSSNTAKSDAKKKKDKDKKSTKEKDKKKKKKKQDTPKTVEKEKKSKSATKVTSSKKKVATKPTAKKAATKKPKAVAAKSAPKKAVDAPKKPSAKKAASATAKKPSTKSATKKKTSAKPAAAKPKTAVTKKKAVATKKATTPAKKATKSAAKKKVAAKPAAKKTISTAKKQATKKKTPTAAKKPAAAKKARSKKLPDIPAILLEGDEPRYSARSGPGARYETGSAPKSGTDAGSELALPEAYGTKRIHLVARDPQWVYAHWDLTNEQLRTYNQLSRGGHLTLQIFENEVAGKAKVQIDVHPESRSWFAHVGKGGGNYYAVLGFHDKLGDWQEISVSEQVSTPPDSLSDDLTATFTTIPVTIPFSELIKVVREYAANEPKLAKALSLMQQADLPESAGFSFAVEQPSEAPKWSKAQQQALADAVSMDEVRRTWIGSEEVLELIKGRGALSSEAAIPTSGISSVSSVSSPFGGAQPSGDRGFWFNVNAELIIYGATEPDASVTIGERSIKLRNDGTFSYRFALPDGQYQLPIAATSADKVETKKANLDFARNTGYTGDVGQHPQDPNLKKPSSENVG